MKTYSQHGEDLFVDSFQEINENSVILDIGANDGVTFSNSRLFIEKYNSKAFLVEPTSRCLDLLDELYSGHSRVTVIPNAISEKNGMIKINVGNLMDLPTCVNQVSTLLETERVYWETNRHVEYTEEYIKGITPLELFEMVKDSKIDLLSIDTEGMDYFTLYELYNLGVKPKFIIFEWNGKNDVLEKCQELLEDDYEMIFTHPVNLIFKLK